MKKYICICLLFTVSFFVKGQENIMLQADKAYNEEDYQQALELYVDAMKLQGTSPELLYNIGNTYFRLGELGNSVLYYKKALKLNPSFKDAELNLRFVRTKIIDKQTDDKTWGKTVTENVIFIMTPNAWAVVGLIFFGIFLFALSQYILGNSVAIRKTAFFGGLGTLALTVLCTVAAFYTSGLARSQKEAVVVSPVVQLSTVPRLPADKSQQAFTLHEGAIVEILDTLNVPSDQENPLWMEVQVNKEHRAWIPATDIEII